MLSNDIDEHQIVNLKLLLTDQRFLQEVSDAGNSNLAWRQCFLYFSSSHHSMKVPN